MGKQRRHDECGAHAHANASQPQQAHHPQQCGLSDLLSACGPALVRQMDAKTRVAWMGTCRQARTHALEAATRLTLKAALHEQGQGSSTLPVGTLSECRALRHLTCRRMPLLSTLQGLPIHTLQLLQLVECPGVSDYSPLARCSALQHLLVVQPPYSRDARHCFTHDQVNSLLTALQPLAGRLQGLELVGLGPQVAQQAHLIGGLTCLHTLVLKHNQLGPSALQALCTGALGQLPTLRSLDLACNQPVFGAAACGPNSETGGGPGSETGPGPGSETGPGPGDEELCGVEALAQVLPGLRHLTTLNLEECTLGDNAAGMLATALAQLLPPRGGLALVHATGCSIGLAGARALTEALRPGVCVSVDVVDPEDEDSEEWDAGADGDGDGDALIEVGGVEVGGAGYWGGAFASSSEDEGAAAGDDWWGAAAPNSSDEEDAHSDGDVVASSASGSGSEGDEPEGASGGLG